MTHTPPASMLHRSLSSPICPTQLRLGKFQSQSHSSANLRQASSSAAPPVPGRGRGLAPTGSTWTIGGMTVNVPPPPPPPNLARKAVDRRQTRARRLQLPLAQTLGGGLTSRLVNRATPPAPKQTNTPPVQSSVTNHIPLTSQTKPVDQFEDACPDEEVAERSHANRLASYAFDLADFDPISPQEHVESLPKERVERSTVGTSPKPTKATYFNKGRTTPRTSTRSAAGRSAGAKRRTTGQIGSSKGNQKQDDDSPYGHKAIGQDLLSFGYTHRAPSVVLLPHSGNSVWISGMRAGDHQGSEDCDYKARAREMRTLLETCPKEPLPLPGVSGRFNIQVPSGANAQAQSQSPSLQPAFERSEAIDRAIHALHGNDSLSLEAAVKAARIVAWGVASREERMGWLVNDR